VYGLRLGYHITEDVFVEGTYGQTRVSDESFRQVLPGGVFANRKETLKYYNLSAGYNVLPGEVFFGSKTAKASAAYIIGGVGSTSFNNQTHQTLNLGLGLRLFFADWVAVQVDMRDHFFPLDVLGKRQNTQNLELTTGATFFF
jgi:outer membrane beta-barrel protein